MTLLGLRVAGPAPRALVDLLDALAGRGTVRAVSAGGAADAWLVLGPADAGPLLPAGAPVALWCRSAADAEGEAGRRAALLLTEDPALAAALPAGRALLVPSGPADGAVVPPFVRARLRAERGLPERLVLQGGPLGWRADPGGRLEGPVVDTALACAAAVAASGTGPVLRALAWGTPVVTDPATAQALGARDGVHLEVAGDDALAAARRLAADEPRAAALGRAGAALAGVGVAARVAAALGLAAEAPLARALGRLDDLGTPPGARVVDRLLAATAGLDRPSPPPAAPGGLPGVLAEPLTAELATLLGGTTPDGGQAPQQPVGPQRRRVPRPGAAVPVAKEQVRRVLRRVVTVGGGDLVAASGAAVEQVRRLRAELADHPGGARHDVELELLRAEVLRLAAEVERLRDRTGRDS